jgi:hypothetical protein
MPPIAAAAAAGSRLTLAQWLGDHVRVPHLFGGEALNVVMVNARYGRVMVEIPIADGSGRVVEYIDKWYDAEYVEAVH